MPITNAPGDNLTAQFTRPLEDLSASINKIVPTDRVITLASLIDHFKGKPETAKFIKDTEHYFVGALRGDKNDKGEEVVSGFVYDMTKQIILRDYCVNFTGDKLDQALKDAFGDKRAIRLVNDKSPVDTASRAANSADHHVVNIA